MLNQQQGGTRVQIGIDGVAQDHGHAHRGRGDEKRNGSVGFHDFGGADQQLAVMVRANQFLQLLLNVPPEAAAVKKVNAAIHEAKTVGRADDGIAGNIENRAAMNRHVRQVAAELLPGIGEVGFDRSEMDYHGLGSSISWPPPYLLILLSKMVSRASFATLRITCALVSSSWQ